MFCPKCGIPLEGKEKFCGSCGQDLTLLNKPVSEETTFKEMPVNYQQTNNQSIQMTQPLIQPLQQQYQSNIPLPNQQKPKKKINLIMIVVIVVILILTGSFFAIKSFILPLLNDMDIINTEKPVQIANIRFMSNPEDINSESTIFNNIVSVTVIADLVNVKKDVDVEILWLYENEEILSDVVNYKSGDWIEYSIETVDGLGFDIGNYKTVFYIDGIAVGNASFEVK